MQPSLKEAPLRVFGIRDIRGKSYRDTGYLRKKLFGYRLLRSSFRNTGYSQKVVTYQRTPQRAKYSLLLLKANCITAQTDWRITDHRGHNFSPSLLLLSVQNSNRMASRLTPIASFPSVFFQLLQYSRQHPSFSAHCAALMTKTDLNYPAISLGFVDFAVQFFFHCKFSFHEKRRSSQV